MSEVLSEKTIHAYAEKIAQRGCADVNRLLKDAADGVAVPEIAHLDKHQQQQVLVELKTVMQVYDRCDTGQE